MEYTIKNNYVKVSADTFGAELHSIEANGIEYLWQCGDAWKRYAPILFPFVCSPEGRTYKADGKDYKMKANHGFARDLEFELFDKDENSVTFILKSNEETLAQYPYEFNFKVKYSLLDDGVKIENIAENKGDKPMYFYIGGHPAFNCPLESGETFNDYFVEYEKPEHLTRNIDGKAVTLVENENKIDVSRELFDYDAIILDNPNSKKISLKSKKSEHSVTVEFPESKCIAVWSPTADDNAKFVCLEPWTSVPVYYDDEFADIEKKPHAIKLEPNGVYNYSYSIKVK